MVIGFVKDIIGWSWETDNLGYIFRDDFVQMIFKLRPAEQEQYKYMKILLQSLPDKWNCYYKAVNWGMSWISLMIEKGHRGRCLVGQGEGSTSWGQSSRQGVRSGWIFEICERIWLVFLVQCKASVCFKAKGNMIWFAFFKNAIWLLNDEWIVKKVWSQEDQLGNCYTLSLNEGWLWK